MAPMGGHFTAPQCRPSTAAQDPKLWVHRTPAVLLVVFGLLALWEAWSILGG